MPLNPNAPEAPEFRLSRYTFTVYPFGIVASKKIWKTKRFFHCMWILADILGITQEQMNTYALDVEALTAKFNDRATRTLINKRMANLKEAQEKYKPTMPQPSYGLYRQATAAYR